MALRSLVVRPGDLEVVVGLSEWTARSLVRRGEFPRPRLLADRSVGYMMAELEAWVASRPVADLPPPARGATREQAPEAAA